MQKPENDVTRNADLICEAILREMGRAEGFSHIEDAWKALLNTRLIADDLAREARPTEIQPRTSRAE